jgi:hypothetical protein
MVTTMRRDQGVGGAAVMTAGDGLRGITLMKMVRACHRHVRRFRLLSLTTCPTPSKKVKFLSLSFEFNSSLN